MRTLRRFLLPDRCNIHHRSILFNTTANVLDAAQTLLLLVAVTRACGAEMGGVFSISMAVAYQMVVIGKYGMRDFQATDVGKEFPFQAYLLSRLATALLMCLWLAGYVLLGGYTHQKAGVMLAVALYKAIDVAEDVYHGYYQREGRLDGACLAQTIRYGLALVIYLALLLLTRNLMLSTLIAAGVSLLAFLVLNRALRAEFTEPAFGRDQWPKVKRLLLRCAPLGISSFLQLYLVNYPKFAIDAHMTDMAQVHYGVLSVPVFVVQLLSISIYRPLLTELARLWQARDTAALGKMLRRQVYYIGAVTLLVLGAGYLLGIPALSWVYGMDLQGYRGALMILLAGGGAAALSGFMTSVAAVLRAQKYLLIGYGLALLLEVCAAPQLIRWAGIDGASVLFTGSMLVLALAASGIVAGTLRKAGHERREAA